MSRNDVKLPATAVFMKCNRDFRLTTLSGWCQLFEANVPAKVPPHAYRDALQAGIVPCSEDDTPDPDVSDAPPAPPPPVMDADARSTELDQAMLKVITRNDPDDFKVDNTPKIAKVIAELPMEFDPRPTSAEVAESYERLQKNIDLVED